jgi:L-alanine-DL-glutamate epimerase-like enolase superfamily enzyme
MAGYPEVMGRRAVEEAQRYVRDGYSAIKLKIGETPRTS